MECTLGGWINWNCYLRVRKNYSRGKVKPLIRYFEKLLSWESSMVAGLAQLIVFIGNVGNDANTFNPIFTSLLKVILRCITSIAQYLLLKT